MTPGGGRVRDSGGCMTRRAAHEAAAVRAVERVGRGRPAIVAVFGEPGSGKTRLLERLLTRARRDGLGAIRGTGACTTVDQPLALLAELCQTASPPRTAAELAAALDRLAAGRPLVVAVDDVQWGDEASVDVLARLLERWPAAPILAIVA